MSQREGSLDRLSIVLSDDVRRLVRAVNDTDRAYPRGGTLASACAETTRKWPDAVAVVEKDRALTFSELQRRAASLACLLRGRGIGPEDRVAILLNRGMTLVIAALGVLKAGAAYVPLDPHHPRQRLHYVLEDSGAKLLITDAEQMAGLQARGFVSVPSVLCLDDLAPDVWQQGGLASPASDDAAAATGFAIEDNLAYVIYTSGSTGRPKGVLVTHRAVLNTLHWLQDTFRMSPSDVVAQKTSPAFTDSVWEIFWPSTVGAKAVVLGHEEVVDATMLCRAFRQHDVSHSQFVPGHLRVFLQAVAQELTGEPLPALKWILNGGEALPYDLACEWHRRFSRARIANPYGMTESAIYATSYLIDPKDIQVLIGKPIGNMRAYVVDPQLTLRPPHVKGQIAVGGRSLMRGYLNQPQQTAERLRADPFSERPDDLLYLTGDLGFWRSDGDLDYCGRMDRQVNIRGFRVELDEVEHTLRLHPAVDDAAVEAYESASGLTDLVAYLVVAPGAETSASSLRNFLKESLPDFMLPARVAFLPQLPLTSVGKVDRRALPVPARQRPALSNPYIAPRTALESRVAELWRDALALDCIGVHDDFFELGGHSLMANQIMGAVSEEVSLALPLRLFFRRPTVAGIVEEVTRMLLREEETASS
jgi:fengycin family lipopeptide synthetase D